MRAARVCTGRDVSHVERVNYRRIGDSLRSLFYGKQIDRNKAERYTAHRTLIDGRTFCSHEQDSDLLSPRG